MSKRNTAALALTAPISVSAGLSLTRAQQDALVFNQVRIQQEEAVCKAALHQVKEQIDAQISDKNTEVNLFNADLTELTKRIASDLKDLAPTKLGNHYSTTITALTGAGHTATQSITHSNPTKPSAEDLREKDNPYTRDGYHFDVTATLTLEAHPERSSYGYQARHTISTTKTFYVGNPINDLLEQRDGVTSTIAGINDDILTLRTKRDSLWSLEDQMKAQLALKSIAADPSQSAALAETTSFLLQKLGMPVTQNYALEYGTGAKKATKPRR